MGLPRTHQSCSGPGCALCPVPPPGMPDPLSLLTGDHTRPGRRGRACPRRHMRPLRVCFVADTENWGGAEVWLVHHLRRAAQHGVEASVVCAEPVADRFRPRVPSERLQVVPLARETPAAPYTEAALRRLSPDLVHVNLVDPASNA